MRFALVVLGCLALLGTGFAQESLKKRQVAPVTGAVTQAEVSTVFARIERTLFRITRLNRTVSALPKSSAPATRGQILARMVRLVDEVKGEFRFSPKRIPFDAASLTIKAPPRAQVERLIAWGFVAKTSPLVTGTTDTVTPAEFGDAIGLFIARMADLTHTPSSKWSPYMSGG